MQSELASAGAARLRLAAKVATLILGLIAALEAGLVVRAVVGGWYGPAAFDFDLYVGFTRSWLRGDGFYLPAQLAGPYVVEQLNGNVYPPTVLYLTLPFALGAPAIFWWAVPLGIAVGTILRARPAWWAWPLLAFLLCYPRIWVMIVTGNPSLWCIALGGAGLVWGWPALGAAFKLTLAPLAFVGAHQRSWWVGAVVAAVASTAFGTMWSDYATVMLNAHSARGLDYVLGEWPLAIGFVAVIASGQRQTIGRNS